MSIDYILYGLIGYEKRLIDSKSYFVMELPIPKNTYFLSKINGTRPIPWQTVIREHGDNIGFVETHV